MKQIHADYKDFLKEEVIYDYAIVDPPWSYDDIRPKLKINQLSYNLWDNTDLNLIFDKINAKYLFIWVTNSMIENVFNSDFKTYKYKTLVTWSKLTTKGNLFYGLGNHFRNNTEHLMLFTNKKVKPLRSSKRNLIVEACGKRTQKPKTFESALISEFENKGMSGLYLFSGDCIMFNDFNIDCVDINF